jgi:hypothetical protein
MDLDNPIWTKLNGGYKIPYNAAEPLSRLANPGTIAEQGSIFKELWENLHHQGDVDLASYLAVPQLIRICISKKSFNWNFIGLCVVIENCRGREHNPELPEEYKNYYFDSLKEFEKYLVSSLKNIIDETAFTLSLAFIAKVNGHTKLSRVLEILDSDEIDELLEKYG